MGDGEQQKKKKKKKKKNAIHYERTTSKNEIIKKNKKKIPKQDLHRHTFHHHQDILHLVLRGDMNVADCWVYGASGKQVRKREMKTNPEKCKNIDVVFGDQA